MPTADTNSNNGPRPTSEPVDRLLLTPEQAAAALSIGRTTIYALLASGRLHSVRIGASRRIPTHAVEDLVAELTGQRRPRLAAATNPTPVGHDQDHLHRRQQRPRRRPHVPADSNQLTLCLDTPDEHVRDRP